MRKIFSSLAVVCALTLVPSLAHADTIYNLTLDPIYYGPVGGTGVLEVNTKATTGTQVYTVGGTLDIESLTFSLDGNLFNFNLGGATAGTNATFSGGNLIALAYNGNDGNLAITLDSGSLYYTFGDTANGALDSSGTVAVSSITTAAAAPEPSSLMLLGTGVLGLAGFVRRRLAV